MNSKRVYQLLIGAIVLLFVGLIGGAYNANKLLTAQAGKLTDLKAKSLAQELQQQGVNKAKKDIIKYADLKKIAQTIVPEDKNQAQAVREIVKIADENDVPVSSITFPASTLGSSAVNTKTGAPVPTAAKPSAASLKAAGLSQLVPVPSIPGVYQITINVQNDSTHLVEYSKFIDFLNDLEHNRRTAQVSALNIQPSTLNRNQLVYNLSVTEYIKP